MITAEYSKRRTLLYQARMQLLQQLATPTLNVKTFGDDDLGTGTSLIAAEKAAFAGTDRTAILNITQYLKHSIRLATNYYNYHLA